MQLALAIRGDLRTHAATIVKAHKRAATTTIRRGTTTLKNAIRRDVLAAKLGQGIANAVRDQVFPARGVASNPKGQIASKAIAKRPGELVDYLTVFREGAVVKATGQFLLIGGRKIGKIAGHKARLAKAKLVVIPARLKGKFEAQHARVSGNLQGNYAREYDRQLMKGA